MMQGSLKLGTLAGIDIRVHYTWFFAFILIAWSLALGYFPTANAGLGAGMYWVLGVVSALLLFGSVLAVSRSTTLPSLVSPRNSLTSVFGRTSMRGLPRT
jgi:hypothetical protein